MAGMIMAEVIGLPELRAKLSRISAAQKIGLERGMMRALIHLQSYIRDNKLHGDPLHQRTGRLSQSITAGPVAWEGDNLTGIESSDNVEYGAVHEFGGTFTIKEHIAKMSQMFGRELAEPIFVTVKEHPATYPQRSFMRSSLHEDLETIKGYLKQGLREGTLGHA